jgi:uncharacterized protein
MRNPSRRLEMLDDLLLGLDTGGEPMLLSTLDGFLAGILVCPDLILPSEWLARVWGMEDGDEPVFESADEAQRVVAAIMEHYNIVTKDLQAGRYEPVFEIDDRHDDVLWEIWMEGFDAAVALRPESWTPILKEGDESEAAMALSGLLMLSKVASREHDFEDSIRDEIIQTAPLLIPSFINDLNARRLARAGSQGLQPRQGKVGRNDPCPCGSGQKYKKCCGAN